MAQPPAEIEGKYEIVAKIKEGGMGAIYRVRHRLLDEIRVVKTLRPQHEEDDELRARFAREARSAIRLRHPNVVQIFDFSVDETGAGFIVMEHIKGVDLEQLVALRRLPSLPLALDIARQSLRALGFLHEHGFVHRDVSPDNLMLTRDVDDLPLVKLIDLGIAKRLDAEQQLTVSGSFLGKFRYASPEHFGARGADGLEARSDLYSFGLVFYEILTGHYPLVAASTSQLIGAHLFHTPRPFSETDPEGRVPEPIRAMALRALDKDAEARHESAEAWVAEIEDYQQQMAPDGDLRRVRRQLKPETESLVTTDLRPGGASPKPGSTQRHLDRRFHVERTPSPNTIDGMLSRPESSIGAADAEALEALVQGAQTLGRIGHVLQARRQLETVLAMDPDHEGARQAVAELGAGPAAQGQIPSEPLSPPPIPRHASADTSRSAAEDPEAEGRVRELLKEAETRLDRAEYDRALDLLHQARDLAPTSPTVLEDLARDVARLDAKLQERERTRAIEQIERHVLTALRLGKILGARRNVRRAREAYGDDLIFDTLDEILDGAADEKVKLLRDEARTARERGDWDRAEEALATGAKLSPEAGSQLEVIQSELEQLRADRRRAERSRISDGGLLSAVAEIERLRMEEGRDAARAALDEAFQHFGDTPLLLEVRNSLTE
ncbi:MAG: protein kinase [Thermoanaerobaculia bacterium]|nr:protein kinase [Thermoanaerobaculia bacterium]